MTKPTSRPPPPYRADDMTLEALLRSTAARRRLQQQQQRQRQRQRQPTPPPPGIRPGSFFAQVPPATRRTHVPELVDGQDAAQPWLRRSLGTDGRGSLRRRLLRALESAIDELGDDWLVESRRPSPSPSPSPLLSTSPPPPPPPPRSDAGRGGANASPTHYDDDAPAGAGTDPDSEGGGGDGDGSGDSTTDQ